MGGNSTTCANQLVSSFSSVSVSLDLNVDEVLDNVGGALFFVCSAWRLLLLRLITLFFFCLSQSNCYYKLTHPRLGCSLFTPPTPPPPPSSPCTVSVSDLENNRGLHGLELSKLCPCLTSVSVHEARSSGCVCLCCS